VRLFKVGAAFSLLLGFLSCQPIFFSSPTDVSNLVLSPSLKDCDIFPSDHIWNTRVDTLPVEPNSDAYVRSIGLDRHLYASFGPPSLGGYDGIPYTVVDNSQAMVEIDFVLHGNESDPGPYPVPRNAPIEDADAFGSDRHVLVVNKDTCMLYELYNAFLNPDGSWKADSGAIYDLKDYALRPDTWTSADAAGLAILPGLVRYEEVQDGDINHALRFAVKPTRNIYVWPARHKASDIADPEVPPMGQRFRLKADFDETSFSVQNRVILRALKTYGMILADNANEWKLFGAPDDRWDRQELEEFKRLHPSDFEAVDISSLMIAPNSAKARQRLDNR
jgi:hypothetical protein